MTKKAEESWSKIIVTGNSVTKDGLLPEFVYNLYLDHFKSQKDMNLLFKIKEFQLQEEGINQDFILLTCPRWWYDLFQDYIPHEYMTKEKSSTKIIITLCFFQLLKDLFLPIFDIEKY